jgi:hypothetical protein
MYNIKIKSVPNKAKTGSQLDYSLVDRNTLFLKPNTPVKSDVKNTMGAVPREQANIEAEGGETVVGDINNDGFLEHQTIVGKRHSQGGVPLNVPEGSFIFSDTKKMIIKDPEVLAIFGMKPSKSGYTPAEIAKKYNINDYIAILKDPAKDRYAKETAQIMLDSNLKKLGMLALVQESMKGFPDGVPAIAESVMGQMMGGQESSEEEQAEGPQEPQEEMQEPPQQRYGGELPKAQEGKNKITESGNPVPGFKFYNGITPVTVKEIYSSYGQDNPNGAYIKLSNGETLTKKQFDQLKTKGFYNNQKGGVGDSYTLNQNIQKRTIKDSSGNEIKGFDLYSGDKFNYNGNDYTVVNPNADNSRGYYNTWKPLRDSFDNTQGIIQVVNNKTGKYEYLEGEDLGDAYKFDKATVPILPNQSFRKEYVNKKRKQLESKIPVTLPAQDYEVVNSQYNSTNDPNANFNTETGRNIGKKKKTTSAPVEVKKETTPVVTSKDKVGKVYETPRSIKKPVVAPVQNNTQSPFIIDTSEEEYEYGGGIYKMQTGGGTPRFNSATGLYQDYDANGKPVGAPYKGTGTTYNVKDADVIEKAKAAGYEVIGNKYAPKVTYVPEQTSKTGFTWNPESGYYESPQFPIGKQGLEETINVWKDELDQYQGPSGKGIEAWKKDFLTQKGAEGPASKYLVNKANEYSVAAGFGPQVDVNQEDAYLPGQDVFSLKKFKKAQVPQQVATTPARKEDVINVQQISRSPITDRGGWSKNATLNFANAFLAKRYHGKPYMPNLDYQTPDYVLPDYSQAVSNVLSGMSAVGRQASDTMSGPQAFNATLGAMGQGLDQVTGIQGQWNNAGVGIANQAYDRAAGIYNQFSPMKARLRAQYNDDVQTLGQQEVNSENAYRSNVYKAAITGNQEQEKMQALKTMFPQVGIDNWNHDIGWSGVGRDPFQYDPYSNPMGSSISNNSMDDANDAYDQAYSHAIKRMSPENAQKYASEYSLAMAKKQMSKRGAGYGTNTASDVYSAMFGD